MITCSVFYDNHSEIIETTENTEMESLGVCGLFVIVDIMK